MTKERYKKSINHHAILAFILGTLALIFCVLTQVTSTFSQPIDSGKTQIALAMAAVLVSVAQYLYTRNILKKRLAQLQNLDTIEQKVSRYYSLMLQSFYMSAVSLAVISAISYSVSNSMLVCLEAVVFLFSVMLLKPSAYRMKMDLELSEKEMALIYGENWDK